MSEGYDSMNKMDSGLKFNTTAFIRALKDADENESGSESEGDQHSSEDEGDIDVGSLGTAITTLCIVEFEPSASNEVVRWIINKIRMKRTHGGAELQLRISPRHPDKGVMLHISANALRLLQAAELMKMQKMDLTGLLREFVMQDLHLFINEGRSLDEVLTTAEKQRVVFHVLEKIRCKDDYSYLPGHPDVKIYSGQSIFDVCLQNGIINEIFPLHDKPELDKLSQKWYWTLLQPQPLEEIRQYFGEHIAMYFSFLGFYTYFLLPPCILGLIQSFVTLDTIHHSFFAVFNLIWITIFLEAWKRHSYEISYKWGTLLLTDSTEARKGYKGKMGISLVTGRHEPIYPKWKTRTKTYLGSYPIVFLCLVAAFYVMLLSFWVEDYLTAIYEESPSSFMFAVTYVPSAVYATLVWWVNLQYMKFATLLTEWENHRTQQSFDHHRVIKLVLFEFVNNFMSLFYIAFYIQDKEMLKSQVAIMLIVQQAINHLQEAVVPYVMYKIQNYQQNKHIKKEKFNKLDSKEPSPINNTINTEDFALRYRGIKRQEELSVKNDTLNLSELELREDDPLVRQALKESNRESYEATYDDYLELFIQFGYVYLFSAVYPLAAFWAVLNNVLEIRADAFKLCRAYKRPLVKQARNIGAWLRVLQITGAIAVTTNCALLCMSSELRKAWAPDFSDAYWIVSIVIVEHFILIMQVALAYLIPDMPDKITFALAKAEYESHRALKRERARKTRQQLKTVFREFASGDSDSKPKNPTLIFTRQMSATN